MRSLMIFTLLLVMQTNASAAEPRIINGTRAKSGQWPWMVALIYAGELAAEGQYCGGTLVHPDWVLTAGHCTQKRMGSVDLTAADIEVLLNRENLADTDKGETIGLEKIVRHPDYHVSDPSLPPFADVALLKLKHPASQTPLQIAETYYQSLSEIGKETTVMGWGSISPSGKTYPNDLYQTTVPIVSNATCNSPRSYNGDVKDTMLCAGFPQGGTDACIGDSGGPLIVDTYNGWREIGLVTFGEGCALPNYYGVYTRLSAFQEFISQTICDEFPRAPKLQVKVEGHQATATWNSVAEAQGYQFYYAQYSSPMNEVTFNSLQSFDMGSATKLSAKLTSQEAYYIAVRAYQGNCYSPYSNLGTVIIP